MTDTPAAIDQEFVDLVANYVRGFASQIEVEELQREENIDRLYDGLISLKKRVETQLASRRSRDVKRYHELVSSGDDGSGWAAHKAAEADWRAKAIKFLTSIDAEIAATKERRRLRQRPSRNGSTSDELLKAVLRQMEAVDEDMLTEEDQQVFSIARRLSHATG